MKKLKAVVLSVWCYVKDSWEGQDGKFSYRRASQYVFLVAMLKAGFWPPKTQWEFYTFITFASLYLLLMLAMSVEQMIALIKYTLPLLLGKKQNEQQQTQAANSETEKSE